MAEALRLGGEAGRITAGAFTTVLPAGNGELLFDPTGLVKGWAVDRAAVALQDLPGVSFCINAGGDLVVGAHPDLPDDGPGAIAWRIGIEDPRDRSRTAHVVTLTRGAVATSGTSARGAHLYDPASGDMVGRVGSTTVHGPTLLWADVWATALFVGDEDHPGGVRVARPGVRRDRPVNRGPDRRSQLLLRNPSPSSTPVLRTAPQILSRRWMPIWAVMWSGSRQTTTPSRIGLHSGASGQRTGLMLTV